MSCRSGIVDTRAANLSIVTWNFCTTRDITDISMNSAKIWLEHDNLRDFETAPNSLAANFSELSKNQDGGVTVANQLRESFRY